MKYIGYWSQTRERLVFTQRIKTAKVNANNCQGQLWSTQSPSVVAAIMIVVELNSPISAYTVRHCGKVTLISSRIEQRVTVREILSLQGIPVSGVGVGGARLRDCRIAICVPMRATTPVVKITTRIQRLKVISTLGWPVGKLDRKWCT